GRAPRHLAGHRLDGAQSAALRQAGDPFGGRGHVGEYSGATVLFDMDGELVDSGSSIREGVTAWSRERGLDPATVLEHAHGRTDHDLVRIVAPHLDPAVEAERIQAQEIAHDTTVRAMPGAADLLAQMRSRGRSWAV